MTPTGSNFAVAGTEGKSVSAVFTFTGTSGTYCKSTIGTSTTLSGTYSWTSSGANAASAFSEAKLATTFTPLTSSTASALTGTFPLTVYVFSGSAANTGVVTWNANASGTLAVTLLGPLTLVPASSTPNPGYNDCFYCVLSGGQYCPNASTSNKNTCAQSFSSAECSLTAFSTLTSCSGAALANSRSDSTVTSTTCTETVTPTGSTVNVPSLTSAVTVSLTFSGATGTYCALTVGTAATKSGTYTWTPGSSAASAFVTAAITGTTTSAFTAVPATSTATAFLGNFP